MRDRWDLVPAAAQARGDEGNRRLHRRWVRFNVRPSGTWSATSRSPASWLVLVAGRYGLIPQDCSAPQAHVGGSARSDPRNTYEPLRIHDPL